MIDKIKKAFKRRRENNWVKLLWICVIAGCYFFIEAGYNGVSIFMDLHKTVEYQFDIYSENLKYEQYLDKIRKQKGVKMVSLQADTEVELIYRDRSVKIEAAGVSEEYIEYKFNDVSESENIEIGGNNESENTEKSGDNESENIEKSGNNESENIEKSGNNESEKLEDKISIGKLNHPVLAVDKVNQNRIFEELNMIDKEEILVLHGKCEANASEGLYSIVGLTEQYNTVGLEERKSILQMDRRELQKNATRLRVVFSKQELDDSNIRNIEGLGCSLVKNSEYFQRNMELNVKWTEIKYEMILGIFCVVLFRVVKKTGLCEG